MAPKKPSSGPGGPSKTNRSNRRGDPIHLSAGKDTVYAVFTPCAEIYAKALADPFRTLKEADLPCVPQGGKNSFKFPVYYEGDFDVGTSGAGYISVCPKAFGKDINIITTTSATSVGTQATQLSTFTALTTVANGQTPSLAATLSTDGTLCRAVAAGLKVSTAAAQSTLSGYYKSASVTGYDLGLSQMNDPVFKNTAKAIKRGDDYTVVQAPSVTFTSGSSSAPSMAVGIVGAPAATSFHYEVVVFYEWIFNVGNNAFDMTSSDVDDPGYSSVSDWVGERATHGVMRLSDAVRDIAWHMFRGSSRIIMGSVVNMVRRRIEAVDTMGRAISWTHDEL